MIRRLLPFLYGACLISAVEAAPAPMLESIEWCDIWIAHANESSLPRILLIGDSITRDYYPGVEKLLTGKVYVARLATSRFLSDPVLAQEIALVLDENKFDVIHFNNGMHGWSHTEAEYRDAFPEFLAALRSHAHGAKLVFATTTPLRESPALPPGDHSKASDERIAERNTIALAFLQPEGVEVDDLNALVRGHPEYHSDNVHFNPQGIALEARQVSDCLEKLLPSAH